MNERVASFVAKECGLDNEFVKISSDLLKDFGIAGDDGAEFMIKYAREFGVDLSGFNSDEVFGSEVAFFPFAVFFPGWWKARKSRRNLTVGDLIELAKLGSWSLFLEREMR